MEAEPSRTDHQAKTAARLAAEKAERERTEKMMRAACTLGAMLDEQERRLWLPKYGSATVRVYPEG